MTNTYEKAYTEVLEILKYLPKYEYDKIPKEKIKFYENNKDNNYIYVFDTTKPINKQKISKEANAIIITLFRDFFATENQKERLQKILLQNEEIYQNELRKKYNPDDLFKNKIQKETQISKTIEIKKVEEQKVSLVQYKESLFSKFLNKIKSFFSR